MIDRRFCINPSNIIDIQVKEELYVLHSKTKWKTGQPDVHAAEMLAKELNISRFAAQLLTARGVRSSSQAASFLGEGRSYDPLFLKGMKEAADRIQAALSRNEKIRIYGDYDADGVTSTAIMIFLLQRLGADFDYYIPHRFHEGYGLNKAAIDDAKEAGVSLIVTVDNGISAVEEIDYANQSGIDVVVTDHHEPPEVLPQACAIVNPKQPGCSYPFKSLAGAGVALKLAQTLLDDGIPNSFLELAALGTIADIMPLIDENRWIVRRGLKAINSSELPGMQALLRVSGLEGKPVSATQAGFALGPRINASGRLGHADLAVRLLTAQHHEEAEAYAQELDQLNKERQRIVQQTTDEAIAKLEQSADKDNPILLIHDEQWNEGVIGIVASKLLEKYSRPAIVFSIDAESGLAKGSARSVPGFSIYEALKSCEDLLEHYGGHDAAAGMTVRADQLPDLQERLNQIAYSALSETDRTPVTYADMECRLQDIHMQAIEELESLAPYGEGNPPPLFVVRGLQVIKKMTMGKDRQHLKLVVRDARSGSGEAMEALLFGGGALEDLISSTASLDLLAETGINEWNGRRTPQLLVRDVRIASRQLLDWRTSSDNITRWTQALNYVQSTMPAEWKPLLLLSSEEQLESVPKPLQCGSPWVYEENGIVPLHDRDDLAWITDLFMFAPPPSIGAWQAIAQQMPKVERIYVMHGSSYNDAENWEPNRDMFVRVYAGLRKIKKWAREDESIINQLADYVKTPPSAVRFCIQVFKELQFVKESGPHDEYVVSPAKKPLDSSILYQKKLQKAQMNRIWHFSSEQELAQKLLAGAFGQAEIIHRMEEIG